MGSSSSGSSGGSNSFGSNNGNYCGSCSSDADCGGGSNFCLPESSGSYCGIDCSEGQSCPSGATCQEILDQNNNPIGANCVPASGSCEQTGGTSGGGTSSGACGLNGASCDNDLGCCPGLECAAGTCGLGSNSSSGNGGSSSSGGGGGPSDGGTGGTGGTTQICPATGDCGLEPATPSCNWASAFMGAWAGTGTMTITQGDGGGGIFSGSEIEGFTVQSCTASQCALVSTAAPGSVSSSQLLGACPLNWTLGTDAGATLDPGQSCPDQTGGTWIFQVGEATLDSTGCLQTFYVSGQVVPAPWVMTFSTVLVLSRP